MFLERLLTCFKMLTLHPMYIQLWIKLAKCFDLKATEDTDEKMKLYFDLCCLFVIEMNKHGYINKSEIMQKQKRFYQDWVCVLRIFNLKY